MFNLAENFVTFWYLYLLLAVLLVAVVVVWRKALRAAAKRTVRDREIIERLEKDKALREEYSALDLEKINAAPSAELARGVGLALEYRFQKAKDLNEAFEELSDGQKYVYALHYYAEDESPGEFFSSSRQPLTGAAAHGARAVLGERAAALICELFSMFDGDNEEVSLDKKRAAEIDLELAECAPAEKVRELVGKYIKNNPENFV